MFCTPLLSKAEEPRPNILLLITDDQRYDEVDPYMPKTKERIFDQGIQFDRAYVTTPACAPSRASIFTGLYASQHAVSTNDYILEKQTFAEKIAKEGTYFLGHVGKYLNGWDGSARPEFDFWVSFAHGSTKYFSPRLNVNGTWGIEQGYTTNIFRDHAILFLEQADTQDKPFLLTVAFNAPHRKWASPPEDSGIYDENAQARNPNFHEADTSDKPRWIQDLAKKKKGGSEGNGIFRKRARETLASVDRAIDAILDTLENQGKLENTIIFFLSDNGILSGEHWVLGKDALYEEAVRVPFALRYGSKVTPRTSSALVANIDIAPTIFELTGVTPKNTPAGSSLTPLFDSDEASRNELLLEGFRTGAGRVPFSSVHTGDVVYTKTKRLGTEVDTNRRELYDLGIDPFQLENRTHDDAYSSTQNDLRARLDNLLLAIRGTRRFRRPEGEKYVP
ncbi:MAG: sulfatase-like hydrolase/transferase [Bdellovibrionales bacterium]|nr:sulfatase-like hydrolase/transferase [Bdellovibrionales bacterium]